MIWPEEPSIKFLVQNVFRRDELCQGDACDEAKREMDEHGTFVNRERCPSCPLTNFENSMESADGALISRAFTWKAALESGFQVTLDEIRADEFAVLQVIRSEAAVYEAECRQRETKP